MIILGNFLSTTFFAENSLAYYMFFLAWPFLHFYVAYKLCQKDGEIVVVRLITFFIFESSVLAVALLFFG